MDSVFVRKAVQQADLNALRVALFQATGDPELATMGVERTLVRGGSGTSYIVAEKHRDALMEKAVKFMMNEAPDHIRRVPSTETLRALMVIANGGETLADEEFGVRKYIP